MKFTHLNHSQRYQIEWRKQQGQAVSTIAHAIGVHRATVYRELGQGSVKNQYVAETATRRALRRRAASNANHPQKSALIWRAVRQYLSQDWSPEQFAGRLKEMGGLAGERVSAQTIYNWVKRSNSLAVTHLRHYRKTQQWCPKRGGLAKGRPSILDRDESVDARQDKFHWEGDTICGARGSRNVIVTLIERKSLYTKLSASLRKKAGLVADAICIALANTKAKTLTVDNGVEFADYAHITETIGTRVYFADPGRPRQRARNENNNGLIRQYLPKGSSLKKVKLARIRMIENRLNHRPRKSLGYKTPHEVFFNLMPTPVAIRN